MADRATHEDLVNARVQLAKARLAHLAAQADAQPGPVERTAEAIRSRPWQGVGLALLAGVALGVTRKRALPALVPMIVPVLRRVAGAGRPKGGSAG